MTDNYIDEDGKFNTQDLLADNFMKNLSGATKQRIANAPVYQETQPIQTKSSAPNYNTEKLLMDLYDTRDNLVTTFNEIGFTKSSSALVDSINKIGTCIKSLGGEVDNFDPLANMSGLQMPKMTKNAERVIDNTREAYSLNTIEETKIEDNGKTITIAFVGKKDSMNWKALGTIEAKDSWMGNEAIDYIYSPESGKMSVKMPTSRGWIDKSDDYKISWELFENEDDLNKEAGKVESNKEIKEEVIKQVVNNIDQEIGDFSIEEK